MKYMDNTTYQIYREIERNIDAYNEMSRDELIETILDRDGYIVELELKIQKLRKEKVDKINKDFQDNKRMVSDILNSLVE